MAELNRYFKHMGADIKARMCGLCAYAITPFPTLPLSHGLRCRNPSNISLLDMLDLKNSSYFFKTWADILFNRRDQQTNIINL